jgi:hypothetical protein
VPSKWNKEKASNSFFHASYVSFFMCRKRKQKNTTNGWFPKEAFTSTPEHPTCSPSENVDGPSEDVGCSLPPREKRAVLKKVTPKKNSQLVRSSCVSQFCSKLVSSVQVVLTPCEELCQFSMLYLNCADKLVSPNYAQTMFSSNCDRTC